MGGIAECAHLIRRPLVGFIHYSHTILRAVPTVFFCLSTMHFLASKTVSIIVDLFKFMVKAFLPDLTGFLKFVPNFNIKMTKGDVDMNEDRYDYSKIDSIFFKYANRKCCLSFVLCSFFNSLIWQNIFEIPLIFEVCSAISLSIWIQRLCSKWLRTSFWFQVSTLQDSLLKISRVPSNNVFKECQSCF